MSLSQPASEESGSYTRYHSQMTHTETPQGLLYGKQAVNIRDAKMGSPAIDQDSAALGKDPSGY